MKISQIVLLALVIPTAVQILLLVLPKGASSDKHCVHMPQYFCVIGVIAGVGCGVLGFIGWLKQAELCVIFALCLGLISCTFLLGYKSLHIRYDETGFTVKRFFHFTKRFSYEDINAVTLGHNPLQFTLHTAQGRIFVDSLAVGQVPFYRYAERKCQEATGRRTIPQKESRLFHGYVRNPGEIAFFPCLLFFAFLALAVWGTVISLKSIDMPSELLCKDIQITNWSEENDLIFLTAVGMELRVAREVITDFEVLQRDIAQQETFSALIASDGKEGQTTAELWNLQDQSGNLLVSQETCMKHRQESARYTICFTWAILLVYSLLLFCGYYILCHAPKYRKLASLLIKREYRNF